jgi:hypothetical protein
MKEEGEGRQMKRRKGAAAVIVKVEPAVRGDAAGHRASSRLRGEACVVSKRYSLANDHHPLINPNVYKGLKRLTARRV